MKKLMMILFFCFFCVVLENAKGEVKTTLLIGNIKLGQKAEIIKATKVEAALNLAAGLSGKYVLIPTILRDSVAVLLSKDGVKPQINILSDTLGADKIVFVLVSRIENMLRVELNLVDAKNTSDRNLGEGFASIHYMFSDSVLLVDLALLQAVQRAFAVAVKDSNLYANCEESFRVFPAPTLIIGGLDYKENPSYFPKWDLFDRPIVSSYDAVESIFEQAKESSKYVVYDIATRDTIYALFNLYIIENHKPPSYLEIEVLDNFLVRRYITGTFTQQKNSADIELVLYEIIGGKLKPIKSEKGIIQKDDLMEFRRVLKDLTKKLLD